MSKSYYRVSFSSNSQLNRIGAWGRQKCQRAIIVFPFQAIHNPWKHAVNRVFNVKELLSCFLFKQFTTFSDTLPMATKCQRAIIVFPFQAIHNSQAIPKHFLKMSKSYYRVSFSSNSQLAISCIANFIQCQRAIIVFPFQAIHNLRSLHEVQTMNVKELLSCFLFKQFTTEDAPFSKRCECQRAIIVFPFQAIHNLSKYLDFLHEMSKSYYRVSFSSNSQPLLSNLINSTQCQRAIIVFPFQAIHNPHHCRHQ